jgi:hypothetical protein
MVEFTELDKSIQEDLKDAVMSDPYGLSPKTLYRNIVGSLMGAHGSDLERIRSVANIMGVSVGTVSMIFEANFELEN